MCTADLLPRPTSGWSAGARRRGRRVGTRACRRPCLGAVPRSSSMRDRRPSSSVASTRAADFCFLRPNVSGGSGGGVFAAASILVLCGDGSVYGASPALFGETVLPRSVVVGVFSQLDGEIEASTAISAEDYTDDEDEGEDGYKPGGSTVSGSMPGCGRRVTRKGKARWRSC